MKMTAGDSDRARVKSSATARSESPTKGEKMDAADTDRNDAPTLDAAARTNLVLPHPAIATEYVQ